MTYDVCNLTINNYAETMARRSFVYGAFISMATIGILTDFILKGKYFYISLVGMTALEIIFLIIVIASHDVCETGKSFPFMI